MTVENELKNLIIERYGTIKKFSEVVGLKYTTVCSILERGVMRSTVDNIIIICRELKISTDELASGKIVPYDVAELNTDTLYSVINTNALRKKNGKHLHEYQKKLLKNTIDIIEDDK